MSRRWKTIAICSALILTASGAAEAAKPVEIPTVTKFYFFANGAGKVPKNDSLALGVLKNYAPPVYYCWFAFQDFSKQNKGNSTAVITVFYPDDTTEVSPTLGGRIRDGSVFDCVVSDRRLEAGSVVTARAKNKSLKGKLSDEFGGQLEIYFGGFDPLATTSAEALGRSGAVVRTEPAVMRPLER